MSLDAMADDFVTRKAKGHLQSLTLKASAPLNLTALKGAAATDGAGRDVTADNGASQAISALTKYIPTEIVTAYVALLGLVPSGQLSQASGYLWAIFAVCLVLCPLAELVLAGAKGNAITLGQWREWPLFPMIASAIAFFVWSLVLPSSIVATKLIADQTYYGLGAVIVVTLVLNLINGYLNDRAGVHRNA